MAKIDPTELMQLAIAKAREGIASGQSPFGCAIAIGDRIVAAAHNLVCATTDITAHAEIAALRQACLAIGELHLTGAVVAATCEPCPMCMTGLHWARVDTVHYGANFADAIGAGFSQFLIPAEELLRIGGSPVRPVRGPLVDECQALFEEFRKSPVYRTY
jgi:tRNA(Arg) A34 adenosine deaminase TadA